MILIVLISLSIYALKSGSKSFAILDVNNLNSINDPILNTAIKATEECNKLDSAYKNSCYREIAWILGKYSGKLVCEKLKKELKPSCYGGYGRGTGKKYSSDIKDIKDRCSETEFYEECLYSAMLGISKELSDYTRFEWCKEVESEYVKKGCSDGIGRRLAMDNKESDFCEKVENKEKCLEGFAFITNNKGSKEEALQICDQLSGVYIKNCYMKIGVGFILAHNKTIEEAFRECEQYPYAESCKQGAGGGLVIKFFGENQNF